MGNCNYSQACSDEEMTLLDAAHSLDQAGDRAAEDAERAAFFADLAADLAADSGPDVEGSS